MCYSSLNMLSPIATAVIWFVPKSDHKSTSIFQALNNATCCHFSCRICNYFLQFPAHTRMLYSEIWNLQFNLCCSSSHKTLNFQGKDAGETTCTLRLINFMSQGNRCSTLNYWNRFVIVRLLSCKTLSPHGKSKNSLRFLVSKDKFMETLIGKWKNLFIRSSVLNTHARPVLIIVVDW